MLTFLGGRLFGRRFGAVLVKIGELGDGRANGWDLGSHRFSIRISIGASYPHYYGFLAARANYNSVILQELE